MSTPNDDHHNEPRAGLEQVSPRLTGEIREALVSGRLRARDREQAERFAAVAHDVAVYLAALISAGLPEAVAGALVGQYHALRWGRLLDADGGAGASGREGRPGDGAE